MPLILKRATSKRIDGIGNVKSQVHTLVCRAGTEIGQCLYEDMRYAFRVALPFFQKWTRVPDDYHDICQQALVEMQQPDFVATWTFLTAWGTRLTENPPHMREMK